jgi:uroporphyrinogen decarboxylase
MGPEYEETIRRWKREGMPADAEWRGFSRYDRIEVTPVNAWLCPAWEVETIGVSDGCTIYRDADGAIKKRLTDGTLPRMPQFLEFPLKGRGEWAGIRARLNPESPARLSAYWASMVRGWQGREHVLSLGCPGPWGMLRDLMGLEAFSLALYDDRSFIEMAAEELADFVVRCLERAAPGVEYDLGSLGEDIAYKTASLVDPEIYERIFGGPCRRIVGQFRRMGIDTILVDSDGNIEELIPHWLDWGINLVYPLEVAAGMDVVSLRRRYGRDLLLGGGIDKRVLAGSRDGIREHVEHVAPVVREGGYLPCPDHCLPHDVPWENFLYYEKLISEL